MLQTGQRNQYNQVSSMEDTNLSVDHDYCCNESSIRRRKTASPLPSSDDRNISQLELVKTNGDDDDDASFSSLSSSDGLIARSCCDKAHGDSDINSSVSYLCNLEDRITVLCGRLCTPCSLICSRVQDALFFWDKKHHTADGFRALFNKILCYSVGCAWTMWSLQLFRHDLFSDILKPTDANIMYWFCFASTITIAELLLVWRWSNSLVCYNN